MENYREVLSKYENLYKDYKKGGAVSLNMIQKNELSDIRVALYNQNTNLTCSICVEELFNVLFNWYYSNAPKEEPVKQIEVVKNKKGNKPKL